MAPRHHELSQLFYFKIHQLPCVTTRKKVGELYSVVGDGTEKANCAENELIMSNVENLFEEIACPCTSPDEIFRFLGQYGICNLAYVGEAGRNPGYIFRGELDFPTPLRSSLERHWFDNNHRDKNSCTIAELLSYERKLAEQFVQNVSGIIDRAIEHGHLMEKKSEQEVYWWLSLQQHYQRGTRLLDFTLDIRFALFFALEHFCQHGNKKYREKGLLIYCFPCRDLRWPYDDEINKSPFRHRLGNTVKPIDMNLAIGCQIGIEWMKEHQPTFEKRYSSPVQPFGWDRAYHPNPRLSFQKGMLVYPYKIESISIDSSGPSWLTQCLRSNASDPFHLGPAEDELPPLTIRISDKSVGALLEYVQDAFGLTPGNVYLDCGRDRLRIES
jgi:hypothetical protein